MRRLALFCAALALTAGIGPVALASAAPETTLDVVVAGTVTDARTGDPLANVCVSVRPLEQSWWNEYACTDEDGTYSFTVPPAKYEVQFDPTDDAYGLQWWDDADSPADATLLVVRRGEPATGIDAELLPGATMTGRAIDGETGKPLDNACVAISAAGVEDTVGYASQPKKQWEVRGLPAGDLTVVVRRCDNPFRFTWAYDALSIEDATVFDLEPGETTDVGKVALVAGATVKGKVTARGSGEPLRASVALDYYPGRSGEGPVFGTVSRANGRYVIRNVQPGRHVPGAYDGAFPHRYAVQWAGGATTMAEGTVFDLAPGETAHENFKLAKSGTITGTLVGADNYVLVEAFSDTYPDVGNRASVGFAMDVDPETGEFVIRGLPDDEFYVCFDGCHYDPAGFWYDGVRDVADATLVRVPAGKTVDITAHFPPGD